MSALRDVMYTHADPGMKVCAAVVALAIDKSRAGDADAWRWLCDDARPWLSWLLVDGMTLDELHRKTTDLARPRRPLQQRLPSESRAA